MRDYSRSEIEAAIDEWVVGKNAERNREILYRRLVDGITYETLAEEFDMSVRQIKRIIYTAQEIIFKHI